MQRSSASCHAAPAPALREAVRQPPWVPASRGALAPEQSGLAREAPPPLRYHRHRCPKQSTNQAAPPRSAPTTSPAARSCRRRNAVCDFCSGRPSNRPPLPSALFPDAEITVLALAARCPPSDRPDPIDTIGGITHAPRKLAQTRPPHNQSGGPDVFGRTPMTLAPGSDLVVPPQAELAFE